MRQQVNVKVMGEKEALIVEYKRTLFIKSFPNFSRSPFSRMKYESEDVAMVKSTDLRQGPNNSGFLN
jgi:hypothetical protein